MRPVPYLPYQILAASPHKRLRVREMAEKERGNDNDDDVDEEDEEDSQRIEEERVGNLYFPLAVNKINWLG